MIALCKLDKLARLVRHGYSTLRVQHVGAANSPNYFNEIYKVTIHENFVLYGIYVKAISSHAITVLVKYIVSCVYLIHLFLLCC